MEYFINRSIVAIVLVCLSITGYGADDTQSKVSQEPTFKREKTSTHFLEKGQQPIKDAEAVQRILNKHTEDKKTAIENSN